jgi:hypothetical protein
MALGAEDETAASATAESTHPQRVRHAAAPGGELLPSAHGMHAAAPPIDEKVPEGHGMHDAVYVPG